MGPRPRPRLAAAAAEAGWRQTRAERAFLRRLARALEARPAPRVAVLVAGGPRSSDLAEVVARAYPGARVTRVDVSRGASRTHAELAAAGRLDVIVDDVRRARGRAGLFRRTFLHLDDGGVFVARGFAPGTKDLHDRGEESLARHVARLMELREWPDPGPGRPEQDDAALARSLARCALAPGHLVATRTGRAYAKLTETEADDVLSLRGSGTGRVLEAQEGLRFRSRCVLRESPSARAGTLPEGFDVPRVSLREYLDVVCAPGQLVIAGSLLLPDSYRHNQARRLVNIRTRELGPRFAEPSRDTSPQTELPGSYFFLDSEYAGHFGHALTEQLSRLWAWPAAKRADPGLRALVSVTAGRRDWADFERALYGAAGIASEDLVLAEGPVRVERLVAATPMLSHPAYVHPKVEEVWARVGRRLVEGAGDRPLPRRIFCSRRELDIPGAFVGERRSCRNGADLEDLFRDRGFTVVHPEELPLAEQARMFRDADVVAGYAGSAMFNLVFAERPTRVVLVSSEAYTARNEHLIASVLGHRLDLVWCRPETAMPEGRWDRKAFTSAFTFDFDREGRFLEGVLADL